MVDPELKRRIREIADHCERSREEHRRQWAEHEQRLEEGMRRLRARHEQGRRLRRDHLVRVELLNRLRERSLSERLQSWWSGGP